MTELEKANKTIEELMKINEELGAYNGEFDAARKKSRNSKMMCDIIKTD